jgi:iron(III) transport system substrate-binding protein
MGMKKMKQGLVKACLTLSVLGSAMWGFQGAMAAPIVPSESVVNKVNALQGDARQQLLLTEAKKEGTLTLYHVNIEDIPAIAAAFTKKYGIKVVLWRGSAVTVTNRLVNEAQGGRFEADIVDNNALGMEALHREKMLQPVKSPYDKDLIPEAFPPGRDWVATTVDPIIASYNTNKIKKADLPKSYADLLDPKWKGMLNVESTDEAWFGTLLEKMGPDKGRKLFKDIVAKNGITVRTGHSLLANLVASGEVPLGLTLYAYAPERLKRKGAPIDWFVIPPGIGQPRGIALMRKVQHPYSALLFYDFMLNEGQQMYGDSAQYPTNKKIKDNAGTLQLTYINSARNLDHEGEWRNDYETTVTKAK